MLAARLGVALLCWAALAVPVAAGAKPRPNVRAEVNRLDRAYQRAVARRQPRAVASLYAKDSWYLSSPAPAIHGRAAIRRHFVTLFRRDGLCGFTVTANKLRVGGSLVLDYVHYRTSLCQAGKVTRLAATGLLAFARQPHGGLKILYDVFPLHQTQPAARIR